MSDKKLYAERDIIEQGQHYCDHALAMTAESLHCKSDIAAELAHRDMRIAQLEQDMEGKLLVDREALVLLQEYMDNPHWNGYDSNYSEWRNAVRAMLKEKSDG